MSSIRPSALGSLDDSLAVLGESLEKLKAAHSVDIREFAQRLQMTAESAGTVRELVRSELPEASWQTRNELDALVQKVKAILDARDLEQQRSRLLALATELERGRIVHRRTVRVNELNHLRNEAVNELRSHAGAEAKPQALPGPQADGWIKWACGLQEPQDTESLQTLRDGFARLDDFIANLEPNMWIAEEPPALEIPPDSEKSSARTQSEPPVKEMMGSEESTVATQTIRIRLAGKSSGRRDELLVPDLFEEAAAPALESNTLTPNDVTPARTEEENQRLQEQERALLAGMMGLVTDPVGHVNPTAELPLTGAMVRETNSAPSCLVSDTVDIDSPAGQLLPPEVSHATGHGNGAAATRLAPERTDEFEPPDEPFIPQGSRERAAWARFMHDRSPMPRPFHPDPFHEPSAATLFFLRLRIRIEQILGSRWRMLLALGAMVVLAAVVAILWWQGNDSGTARAPAVASIATSTALAPAVASNNTSTVPVPVVASSTGPTTAGTAPVDASKAKVPDLPRSNADTLKQSQSGTASEAVAQAANTKTNTKDQKKPADQGTAAKPPAKAQAEKQPTLVPAPMTIPKNGAPAKKEEAALSGAPEIPIPSAPASSVPNSVASVVGDIPVAVPAGRPEAPGHDVKIASGVAQGLLVHQVPPRYPPQAQQAHIQGTVVLQALIGKDGSVQNLQVISGHPMLKQAAVDAVKRWRYKPYSLNGQPVEATTQINVNFTLSGQ